MPSTVEDDDPGDGPGVHFTTSRSFRFSLRRPKVDVDEFIDRLKFMGLDVELVAEARRQLEANSRRGMKWIEARLKELEPPRKPPECQCGEELVDAAWRGRATVLCGVCGSRWGIEVIDEDTESIWWVSGATAEWMAAHPLDDDDPYGEFQPEDVLRDGLPPLPPEIAPGTYFPVAMWRGDRHSAVLYVHRQASGDFDTPGDEYEDETEHLVLEDDGEWTSTGSGGGNWVNVFDPPVDLLEKYVVLGTGTSGVSDDDGMVSFTGGMCSSSVGAVMTTDDRGTQTYPIDRDHPFFVVGIHGAGRVRILNEHGVVLVGNKDEPLDFAVGD